MLEKKRKETKCFDEKIPMGGMESFKKLNIYIIADNLRTRADYSRYPG